MELRFSDVKWKPNGDCMRAVLDMHGKEPALPVPSVVEGSLSKGTKDRAVPISDRLADATDGWAAPRSRRRSGT